jgi:SAM-dependent MidA family methyltransferase
MARSVATYYGSQRAERDYLTAPQISPAFGHLIGRAIGSMWRAMGEPQPFVALEVGAGDGTLAAQVRGYLSARERAASIPYVALDRYRPLDCIADALLLPVREITGCILSNELFDALPVHRLIGLRGGVGELWVDAGRFVPGPLSDPELAAGLELEEGQIADVSPLAPRIMSELAGRLARGFVLTIDYGGEGEELFGRHRRAGTLLAYHRHRASDDVLARPGEQDLTAHVDFGALRLAGESAGLRTALYTSQRAFLLELGLKDWQARLDPTRLTIADLYNARLVADELVRRDRLGKLRVLVQTRGIDALPRELGGQTGTK